MEKNLNKRKRIDGIEKKANEVHNFKDRKTK